MVIDIEDVIYVASKIIIFILMLGAILFLSNNFIEYKELSKIAPTTHPVINNTEYLCQPSTTIHWNIFQIYWNYWYVYIFTGVIIGIILLIIYSQIITFKGGND